MPPHRCRPKVNRSASKMTMAEIMALRWEMDLSPGRVMAPVIAEAGEMRCCMGLCFNANYFQKGTADLFHLHVGKTKERAFHQAAVVDGAHLIHQQIRWLRKTPRRRNPDTQRLGIVHQKPRQMLLRQPIMQR